MRLSLPFRIFIVHLLFMCATAAGLWWMVQRSFEEYRNEWTRRVATRPTEEFMNPLVMEVARSLLLQVEGTEPESRALRRGRVAESLNRVLPAIPSVRRLAIVDADGRVAYVNDPAKFALRALPEDLGELPESGETRRRSLARDGGAVAVEERFAVMGGDGTTRLGAVILTYAEDEAPPPGEEPFGRFTRELARSLLEPPSDDEPQPFRFSVSKGLGVLLSELPLQSLLIVDNERRIRYVNEPQVLDLAFPSNTSTFDADRRVSRIIETNGGPDLTEIMLPVFDRDNPETGQRGARLGSILVRYRADLELAAQIPALVPPNVTPQAYLEPLILFLALALGGGIVIALVTTLPVRRLERVFAEFRQRGFRGGLDPKRQLTGDLKQTVEAIREMGGKLEALDAEGVEREALLETLSQSLEDGMLAVDPQGAPLAWNPAAMRLLCGGPAQVGADEDRLDVERKRLVAALARNPDLQFGLDRVELGRAREVELVRHDGWKQPARITQMPVELRPNEHGWLLLIRDVGTLRRVEAHLLEAGRFATLAHLAAGLAHEIRNPLHAISINAGVVEQYAQRGAESFHGEAVEDSLATIKSEAKRLTDLLNNYLGMVRPGEEVGPADLRDVARRVLQLVRYSAQRANVEIEMDAPSHFPTIQADSKRMQQAVLNLVLNAIQAMPDGGRVALVFESDDKVVKLTVSDTGPGLPQEVADRLFDARLTTKVQGTGLGLPLVRLIVESHGGSVSYRSSPEGGAQFQILLPVVTDELSGDNGNGKVVRQAGWA